MLIKCLSLRVGAFLRLALVRGWVLNLHHFQPVLGQFFNKTVNNNKTCQGEPKENFNCSLKVYLL